MIKRSTKDNKSNINNTSKFTPRNLTKANTAANKTENEPNNSHLLKVGMQVEHIKFGQGKILQIEGSAGNKKAIVFFQSVGQKQLFTQICQIENNRKIIKQKTVASKQ